MHELNCMAHVATDNAETAYQWLAQGKILAYPTESVWGLGCNAFDEQAVQELLTLKNRSIDKGLIVLTASELLIREFWQHLPTNRQTELLHSWNNANCTQQATTWLFDIPNHLSIPNWIIGNHNSLAIRIIHHKKINQLCHIMATSKLNPFGFLVSTSCNINQQPPATDFKTAYAYFGDKVRYLKGETLGYDKPSQIKNAVNGQSIRL